MTMRGRGALLLMCSLVLVGCRQADGPMPETNSEVTNRLGDLGRDLQNVAAGDPAALGELSEDLGVFAESGEALDAAAELSHLVAEAIGDVELPGERAAQLANSLWVVMAGRELSEAQREAVREELRLDLVAVGASEDEAATVAAQVSDTQQAVSTRPRRWYEVF